jgi:hypothetical protein
VDGRRDDQTCVMCDGRGEMREGSELPGMARRELLAHEVPTLTDLFRCECCALHFHVAYQIEGDPNSSHFCFSCVLDSATDPAFGGDVALYAAWCLNGSEQDANGDPVVNPGLAAKPCSQCDGAGFLDMTIVTVEEPCPRCHGSGVAR